MGAPYAGNGSNDPPWWPSRYGPDDTRGASNELSAERLLAALRIPARGEIVELALPLRASSPRLPSQSWKQAIRAEGASEEHRGGSTNRDTYLDELVVGGLHNGCHIDALGHGGIDGRFYNGRTLAEIFHPDGLRALGIERAGPWICRGVCLDVAAALGAERLEGGFAIEPEHLEDACRRQGVTISAGDAVLLHTGWAQLYEADPQRYSATEPGADWEAAHWLTERRVSLVGADNWGFEVVPSEPTRPGQEFPVHQHLLAETGTNILENIDTSPLARLAQSEFLFVASPAKIAGATAGAVNPLALI